MRNEMIAYAEDINPSKNDNKMVTDLNDIRGITECLGGQVYEGLSSFTADH